MPLQRKRKNKIEKLCLGPKFWRSILARRRTRILISICRISCTSYFGAPKWPAAAPALIIAGGKPSTMFPPERPVKSATTRGPYFWIETANPASVNEYHFPIVLHSPRYEIMHAQVMTHTSAELPGHPQGGHKPAQQQLWRDSVGPKFRQRVATSGLKNDTYCGSKL